jgi:hypothetical protein
VPYLPQAKIQRKSAGNPLKGQDCQQLKAIQTLAVLLLVAILTKSLFAFVRCNFVTLTLFSTRHNGISLVVKN